MERAHLQRLWQVAEDLFEVQHKPLQAFLVLHLLLLHRPAPANASAPSPTPAAHHRYVTDTIFERDGCLMDATSHETGSARAASAVAPTHDLSRPALPPYLKREEALTRARAAEMLLCAPTPTSPLSSSSSSSASSARGVLSEGLSKHATQEVLTLAEQVLAPLLLLLDNRRSSAGASGAASSSSSSFSGAVNALSSGEIDESTTMSSAAAAATATAANAARAAHAAYFFNASTVVGLAWPAEAFVLPSLSVTSPSAKTKTPTTTIRVGASLSLPVIPVSVLVRVHLLGARVAVRTRRLRRALALLHVAEAWVAELLGSGVGEGEAVEGEGDGFMSSDAGTGVLCVRALRRELLSRLDEANRQELARSLFMPANAFDHHVDPFDVVADQSGGDALDALLTQWVRVERWCCVRLLRAELCQVYHALLTTIHTAQLLRTRTTPAPAASERAAASPPLQGLTHASLQAAARGGSSSSSHNRNVSRLTDAGRPWQRPTMATLDVKTRLKEYGEYVAQLTRSASPQPTLSDICHITTTIQNNKNNKMGVMCESPWVAWSAVLGDSFLRAELGALLMRPDQASPLQAATDMVLTHFQALGHVLEMYYDTSTRPAPRPSSYEEDVDVDLAERRARHRCRPLTTLFRELHPSRTALAAKRAREETGDDPSLSPVQPHHSQGEEEDSRVASEYALLHQLVLLGFEGSLVQWQQWQQQQQQHERKEEGDDGHDRHCRCAMSSPHWLSRGVRLALDRLLRLYTTVHCPSTDAPVSFITESDNNSNNNNNSASSGTVSAVDQELRELLRCIDHEMLALSGRHDHHTPPISPDSLALRRSPSAAQAAATSQCVQWQETSPFHQVRLLILMKTSALMLAASASLQRLELAAALDQLVNVQSFMGVLYQHVQHVASSRADMHILVACVAMQIELRDISSAVLEEALAGPDEHPPARTASTFLSQLRSTHFAGSSTTTPHTISTTTTTLTAVAESPALLAELLHDVGLPLFHLLAAERAAQEGLLYTHPATRLLIRLMQALAVYQCSAPAACWLELVPQTSRATWRPLAVSQRQRCAAALSTLLTPLMASFDACGGAEVDEATVEVGCTAPSPSPSLAPARVGWTPANRVLFLLLRGLWLLAEDHDELSARRAFKKAAQTASRHLGMLDALTADALQWLSTATTLSEHFSTPSDPSAAARTAQCVHVAVHVAMRCGPAALWRLGEAVVGVGQTVANAVGDTADAFAACTMEGGQSDDVRPPPPSPVRLSVTLRARWDAAVREVCGVEDNAAEEAMTTAEEAGPSLFAHKRRRLLVAAMTFLPGSSSYARLT